MSDGFLEKFMLVGGPCDGMVVDNGGPTPLYVNEQVRFGKDRRWRGPVTAVYRMNADGTGTWLEGR